MPGARELIEALGDHDHLHLALLTGNYREAAEIKLTHFELWDFFEWGAFSDDAADRNALVPIARQRAETYDVPAEALERVIVIGDTPHDIACARVGRRHVDRRCDWRAHGRRATRGRRRHRAAGLVGYREGDCAADVMRAGSERGGSAWESNPACPQGGSDRF